MTKLTTLITVLLITQNLLANGYETAIEKAKFLIKEHQQQTNIPGIQVALMVGDSLVWSEGFGFSDLQQKIPVSHNTKFRIASVSKPVTSLALGKMIEQGIIDIDENIDSYLPEFPDKKHPITSRHLATSTAGIRHYTNKDPEFNNTNYPDVISSLQRFKGDALLFEPGSEYHYSSYGWVLLSAVMSRAAKKPFAQLMQESWNQLGMKHTMFDFADFDAADKSKHYVSGKRNSRTEAPFDDRSYMYAGGGYISTAEDLVLMGSKLITNQYISPATSKILLSSYQLKDGSKTHYGLGWETGQNRTKTPVVYHGGSMPSARAHLVIFPEKNTVFAYLANTGDHVFFNDREAHSLAELFVSSQPPELNTDLLIGTWEIETTSLRNRKTKGVLQVSKNAEGIIAGSMTFKRSKKEKTFPVVLAGLDNNQFHLIAVSPMFLDLYLTIDGSEAKGSWLHDFNINGTPEADDYWQPRAVTAIKKKTK